MSFIREIFGGGSSPAATVLAAPAPAPAPMPELAKATPADADPEKVKKAQRLASAQRVGSRRKNIVMAATDAGGSDTLGVS